MLQSLTVGELTAKLCGCGWGGTRAIPSFLLVPYAQVSGSSATQRGEVVRLKDPRAPVRFATS